MMPVVLGRPPGIHCPFLVPRAPAARIMPSLASQPSRHIRVPSFGRFDEIAYLVEMASGLTLLARKSPGTARWQHLSSLG